MDHTGALFLWVSQSIHFGNGIVVFTFEAASSSFNDHLHLRDTTSERVGHMPSMADY